MTIMDTARKLSDGFSTLVSSLMGGASDRALQLLAGAAPATQFEVEAAFRHTLFRKIVTAPASDITREWRNWQADKEQIEAIEKAEQRLDLQRKLTWAMVLGRLYGGAIIYMGGAKMGDPSQPLDVETVGKDALEYLHVFSRHDVTADEVITDPTDPYYGHPRQYVLTASGSWGSREISIHPSRTIRFIGLRDPSPTTANANSGWGDSLYDLVRRSVDNAEQAFEEVSNLTHTANVDVLKIKGMMGGFLTAGYETLFRKRMEAVSQLRSTKGMLLVDSDDDYVRQGTSFGGLPDVLQTFLMMVCAVADIPATRLLGRSPDGMNATGESDIRNYYDRLAGEQENELTPTIRPLDEALIRTALGTRPPEVYFEWAPLWQPTPKERADIDKAVAETIKVIADTGVIPPSAMAKAAQNRLIENQVFPGLDKALEDAEAEDDVAPIEEKLSPAEELAAQEEARAAAARAKPANSNRPQVRVAARDGTLITDWETLALQDARPRTLYVRRDVINAAEIRAWAKAQGFENIADGMHVTIAYSRVPVDWMKIGSGWGDDETGRVTVKPGGPRVVEKLGNATVLMFSNSNLAWRHESMRHRGAEWEWEDYQPHVSITYEPTGTLDLSKVEPYRGKIVLGPEIFEEVKD